MHISGIQWDSVVDGEGIRNTLFISGCLHRCLYCHNRDTWSFKYGKEFDIDSQLRFINKCKNNPLLQGITISGGDSMFSCKDTIDFIHRYKKEIPEHDIWLYTGFTFGEICEDKDRFELFKLCDVVVDGKYVHSLRDVSLSFKGSSNQLLIDVKETLKQNKVVIKNI